LEYPVRQGRGGARARTGRARCRDDRPQADNTLYCSFCGKSQYDVRELIAGPTVFICDECVALCDDIIENEEVLAGFCGG